MLTILPMVQLLCVSNYSYSGNLTSLISDHFIQFMFIKFLLNNLIIMYMIILILMKKNLSMIFLK